MIHRLLVGVHLQNYNNNQLQIPLLSIEMNAVKNAYRVEEEVVERVSSAIEKVIQLANALTVSWI